MLIQQSMSPSQLSKVVWASLFVFFIEMKCSKKLSPQFFINVLVVLFNYCIFVFKFMSELQPRTYSILMVIYHILFTLFAWSYLQSFRTDPGRVPPYWGFHMEEEKDESHKRRYCLICHIFKPPRYIIINTGVITVRPADVVCWTWTVTMHGWPTVSASITANISSSSSSTYCSLWSSPSQSKHLS